MGYCSAVPWGLVLRVMTILCGAVICAFGAMCIGGVQPKCGGDFELRRFIASCYVCMFGLLIVLAEVRIVAVLKWFPFLTKPFGLGLFELFVALIAYGSGEVYEIVMACILGVCGLMYIFFGCMCRNLLGEDWEKGKRDVPEMKPVVP